MDEVSSFGRLDLPFRPRGTSFHRSVELKFLLSRPQPPSLVSGSNFRTSEMSAIFP